MTAALCSNSVSATLANRHRPRKRTIQHSEAPVMESKSRGVLDNPLEPVVGLAEGETRWRGMTVSFGARAKALFAPRLCVSSLPVRHRPHLQRRQHGLRNIGGAVTAA